MKIKVKSFDLSSKPELLDALKKDIKDGDDEEEKKSDNEMDFGKKEKKILNK